MIDAETVKRMAVTIAALRDELTEHVADTYALPEILGDALQHLRPVDLRWIEEAEELDYFGVLAWFAEYAT